MGSRGVILVSILALAAVGAAGYLGWQSSQASVPPTPQAPATVQVTACDIQQTVTAPGSLVNTRQVTLEMPSNGRLAHIDVRAGDPVKAGQVLAVLGDGEKYTAALAAADLELLQAQDALQKLHEDTPTQNAEAQKTLAEAEKRLDEAQRARRKLNYPRARDELVVENARVDYALAKDAYKDALRQYNLVDQKRQTNPERVLALKTLLAARQRMDRAFAVLNWYLLMPSGNEIARADAELALAQAALEQAKLQVERLTGNGDTLDLALAQAKIADAQAKRNAAQQELEQLEVRAPFDGVVLEVKVSAGETLAEGSPILVLNDPTALEIESSVIEEDLPRLQSGQPASVFFDALPEAEVRGSVARIVPQRIQGDRPLYPVFISISSVPNGLVAGMTADASIVIAETKNALCLPRAVVRASAGDTAVVSVWNGVQEEKRTIQVGLRGDVYIEILSGLKAGEQVISK